MTGDEEVGATVEERLAELRRKVEGMERMLCVLLGRLAEGMILPGEVVEWWQRQAAGAREPRRVVRPLAVFAGLEAFHEWARTTPGIAGSWVVGNRAEFAVRMASVEECWGREFRGVLRLDSRYLGAEELRALEECLLGRVTP